MERYLPAKVAVYFPILSCIPIPIMCNDALLNDALLNDAPSNDALLNDALLNDAPSNDALLNDEIGRAHV